jgi:hypothetical protein
MKRVAVVAIERVENIRIGLTQDFRPLFLIGVAVNSRVLAEDLVRLESAVNPNLSSAASRRAAALSMPWAC